MKYVILSIFLLAQNLFFSQVFSEDYFYIQSENKKCKLTIDTLIVDTTFHYRKWVGCRLEDVINSDTSKYDNLLKDYTIKSTCNPKEGVYLLVNQKGERESIGFLTTNYKFKFKWPFYSKEYYKIGLWILYNNGKYYRTEAHALKSYHQTFIQLHENGNIYILRLVDNENHFYTEFYNEEGELIKSDEEMRELEEKLKRKTIK